jgi:hypothetical protein
MTASFKDSLERVKNTPIDPEDPREILNQLVKALNEIYPNQLDGSIGIGEMSNSVKRTSYNFYLIAAIGGGYVYPLFSLEPVDISNSVLGYPFELKAGAARISEGIANNGDQLSTLINKALEAPYLKTIIQNLVSQTEQYKTNRNS